MDETATRAKAEKEIIGETVLTKYNNKNYRIDGIDWQLSPLAEFEKSDGSKISYKDYYKVNCSVVGMVIKQGVSMLVMVGLFRPHCDYLTVLY